MLLIFPCPGTIPVPSCWPSWQMSCCVPPSSSCAAAAPSHLSTAPTIAPMPSVGVDPTPSPSGSGRGMRLSPSAASKPARKRMPHLAVCDAVANRWASAQAVLPPPSGSRFQTRWFLHLPLLRRHQAAVQETFFWSWTGLLNALDWRRHPSLHRSGSRTVSSHRLRD
jgi:hypothetical protein